VDIERLPTNVCLFGQGGPVGPILPIPLEGNGLSRSSSSRAIGLPPFQNSFEYLGREQAQAQYAAEIGFVDGLSRGEVSDRGVVSRFQHLAPAMGAHDRLHQRAVDPRARRSRRHDLLTAALVAQADRDGAP
jgi:hypothetical protein